MVPSMETRPAAVFMIEFQAELVKIGFLTEWSRRWNSVDHLSDR
jgi:hypothetical protein